MPFVTGFLSGILLTVLVVFLVDNLTATAPAPGVEPRKIVNWDVAAEKLSASISSLQEQVRQDVHDATR